MQNPAPAPHPLRQWRREHGLTLEKFAETAGATAATLSRLETRQAVASYRLAKRLSRLTDIPFETFLNDER